MIIAKKMANNNSKIVEKTYNEVPYMSKTFYYTLPERTSAVMKLFGFSTNNTKKARVLEIGCSFGGNIIPFAIANPEAEVIGMDLAEVQIREGQKIIENIGLKNIKLYQKNVLDYNHEFGKFDYIVCHGVFSWVDLPVQNKIIEIIKNGLTENGIATVSYNTNPGWRNISILRDIMLFRAETLKNKGLNIEGADIVKYGKGAVEFIKDYSYMNDGLKKMAEEITNKDPYYIYHEYYETNNKPLYLYEFNKMLNNYGLSHICDSDISRTIPIYKDDKVDDMLNRESENDSIIKEQYYDYIYNRQFRISIISHIENKNKINISKDFSINNLKELYVRIKDKNIENLLEDSSDQILKDITDILMKNHPNTVSFEDIINNTNNSHKAASILLKLIYGTKIEILSREVKIIKQEKLKLNENYKKYLKYCMEEKNPVISFSNFLGYTMSVRDVEYKIMLLFDGTRTDLEIEKTMLAMYENNEINIENTSKDNKEIIENTIKNFIKNIRNFIEEHMLNI